MKTHIPVFHSNPTFLPRQSSIHLRNNINNNNDNSFLHYLGTQLDSKWPITEIPRLKLRIIRQHKKMQKEKQKVKLLTLSFK